MKEKKKTRHPWRLCPVGEHWVLTHPRRLAKKAGTTEVDGHCRKNPSRKDRMRSEEIRAIARRFFGRDLDQAMPSPDTLDYPHNKGNPYDRLIAGWTRYWNEVLSPDDPLDPDLVKALIGSESSFNAKPRTRNAQAAGKARGLLQITDQALKILKNDKGELKDHLIELTRADLDNPETQICAGIRWLFHKKRLASGRLEREATWDEAVADYKGYLNALRKKDPKAEKGMLPFQRDFERLKKGKKK